MIKNIWKSPIWTTKKILMTIMLFYRFAWIIMVPLTLWVIGTILNALHRNPIATILGILVVVIICKLDKKQYLQKHGY